MRLDVLLTGGHIFGKDLDTVFRFELSNETRIPDIPMVGDLIQRVRISDSPKLAGYAEILTATNKGVALAGFGCSRNARRIKIFLFATGDSH